MDTYTVNCDGWFIVPYKITKELLANDMMDYDHNRIMNTVQGEILSRPIMNKAGMQPDFVLTTGRDGKGGFKEVKILALKGPTLFTNVGKNKLSLWFIPDNCISEFGYDFIQDMEKLITLSLKPLKCRIISLPFRVDDRIIRSEKYIHKNDLKDRIHVEI